MTEIGVATHFFVLRHGLANSVSRHTFWCGDPVEWLGCYDTTFGVTTKKPHCGLKWCRDTIFDVTTRSGPISVMTWSGLLGITT